MAADSEGLEVRLGQAASNPVTVLPPELPGGIPTFPLKPHRVLTSDSLRKVPYAVRGREQETGHAAARLQSMPNPILLITGTPGCGKTSLVTNIEQYAMARGCRVIRLKLHDFESDDWLTAAIIGDAGQAKRRTAESSSETGSARLGPRWFQFGKAETAAEHREMVQGTPWYQALTLMANAHPEHGVLYTWDEVQTIRGDETPVSDETRMRIHHFIVTMHTHMLKEQTEQQQPPKLMLLAAGLLNAQAELERIMISRFDRHDVMRIGPLSERAARQIIHDHMTAQDDSGQTIPQLPEAIVHRIVTACGGNPQHLAAAGYTAQTEALRAARDQLDSVPDEAWQRMQTIIRDTREKLYSDRVGDTTLEPRRIAAGTLAQAMEDWGPQLPRYGTEQLIDTIARANGQTGTDLIDELIRKGILERREDNDYFPSREPVRAAEGPPPTHYCFPIHSMRDWLNAERRNDAAAPETTARYQAWIDATIKRASTKTINHEWTWNHDMPYTERPLEPLRNSVRNHGANTMQTAPPPPAPLPPSSRNASRVRQILGGLRDQVFRVLGIGATSQPTRQSRDGDNSV